MTVASLSSYLLGTPDLEKGGGGCLVSLNQAMSPQPHTRFSISSEQKCHVGGGFLLFCKRHKMETLEWTRAVSHVAHVGWGLQRCWGTLRGPNATEPSPREAWSPKGGTRRYTLVPCISPQTQLCPLHGVRSLEPTA